MRTIIGGLLIIAGSTFALIAAIGVLRMPDLPMRMHAATKAGTLGTGLVLVAVSVQSADPSVVIRAAATVVFLFLTAPVAAHMIARAAYLAGTMVLYRGTVDEWADYRRQAPDHTGDRPRHASPQDEPPRAPSTGEGGPTQC